MVIRRGEIWWVDFGEPRGSGPAYRRPALVVQSDRFNDSRIRTVLVALLTSNTAAAQYPGNVLLPATDTGLPKDSVANVSQLAAPDRSFLTDHVSTIPDRLLAEVDEGLRQVLDL